jgi:hypothetical protein
MKIAVCANLTDLGEDWFGRAHSERHAIASHLGRSPLGVEALTFTPLKNSAISMEQLRFRPAIA